MASKTTVFARSPDFKSPLGRVAFAFNLFKLSDKGKFGCTLIFPKDDKSFFLKIIKELLLETKEWGGKAALERFEKNLIKNPLLTDTGPGTKSPARSKKTDELHPGFDAPGMFFIRPISGPDRPPYVWWHDSDVRETTDKNVGSGDYGKAVLNLYSYHNTDSGDGIGVGISKFQKHKTGDRLGGGGGDSDAEKWHETIADEGPAPNVGGGGASALFGD